MAAEILVEGQILAETQVFTHHFHREHFGIRQGGHWPALAQRLSPNEF
jgi:hypothetical protein